jgi:pimeloyl-ACP methyl ester carboxylesterase
MPNFHSNGVDFYYEVHGHGHPFVFSHGLSGSLERVKEFVVDLPGTRTIVYDNRAHGRTRPLGDTAKLNFARMADDVADLLDHLAVEKAVIGGVSMGAGIALAFGLRHSERARGLVLSRPAWLDRPSPPNLGFAPILADIVERHGISGAVPIFEQTEYYRELLSISPGTADSLRTLLRDADEATLLATYRHIPVSTPVDCMDRLRMLRVPALVIGNRNDPIHPFAFAEAWARMLPGSRFQEIVSRFEDADNHTSQFRAAVTEYLLDLNK